MPYEITRRPVMSDERVQYFLDADFDTLSKDERDEWIHEINRADHAKKVVAQEIASVELSNHAACGITFKGRRQYMALRNAIAYLLENYSYDRNELSTEIKRLEIEETTYGALTVVIETGLIGDEGTMNEYVSRNYRHFFVGPKGGLSTYKSTKRSSCKKVTGLEALRS